jgi:hypothetical protein
VYVSNVANTKTLIFYVNAGAGVTQARIESAMTDTDPVFTVTLTDGTLVPLYDSGRDSTKPSVSKLGMP